MRPVTLHRARVDPRRGLDPVAAQQHQDTTTHRSDRNHGIETHPARKTTELIAYVAAVLAVAVAVFVVGDDARTRRTRSAPSRPLRYITLPHMP